MKNLALALLALALVCRSAVGQAPPAGAPPERPRVFLDCSFFCDFDHFRREIGFVDWVRDRTDADVHVLGTAQGTGGGGREFTLAFIGLRRLSGLRDTLRYFSGATETEAETRAGITSALTLGLVRYAAGFGVAKEIRVTYAAPTGGAAAPAAARRDPWNYWVFRVRANPSMNGERHQHSFSINGGANASRVTERLKITVSGNGSYRRSSVDLDSVTTYVNITKNYSHQLLVVSSVSQHWSVGLRERASQSTFFNQDYTIEAGGAVEFDVYPYRESTRRQFTVTYVLGAAAYGYEEETIFDRTSEVRPLHLLNVALETRQPWGSIEVSLEGRQYLHDLARHRVDLGGGFNLRVFKGLQLNAFGHVARVKDQLYLPKGGLSTEEILVQRRQLGTNYTFGFFAGLSYSFGSIFNNVVNPRMNQID